MPSALIVLAEGGEEMEIIIVADMLRRAGINVTIGGLEGANPINCINNIKIVPDKSLTDALKAAPYDAIVCPGGEKGPKSMIEVRKMK
ncbi:protein dj-1 [Plakobranchus ocellatus]|uniref:Protein dj-1 n=1 Tax=Plakobranchus ocellatus TaxID=259542 RepID=A0AAV3YRB6_9GAST|nr:protein dj-1 [Plakobranchus ocellatus]